MTERNLNRMRVRRKPWNLARIASPFLPALREIEAQREPWAEFWDDHNRTAMAATGPLWVALGDSVGQGIGASAPQRGFVLDVVERLRESTGEPWRVVNLTMTGARISHVVEEQLPAVHLVGLKPAVTTCMIGFNDFIGGTRGHLIETGGRALVAGVPAGTLVGRVGGKRFQKRTAILSKVFDEGEASGQISMFHPYDWPDGNGVWARDRVHLSDKGYRYLAESVYKAMVGHGTVT